MNSRVWRAGIVSLQLMESAPTSASAAEDMTALIICAIVRMMPLFGGLAVLLDMKKCQPARLHVFDLDRYDAMLCPARTMSLAWYVTILSGLVEA